MGKIFGLFIRGLESGQRQYIAEMETKDGDKFTATVRAYSTEEALIKIENNTADGCVLIDMRIIDEYSNIF